MALRYQNNRPRAEIRATGPGARLFYTKGNTRKDKDKNKDKDKDNKNTHNAYGRFGSRMSLATILPKSKGCCPRFVCVF
jgi:hypothetical protein